MFKLNRILQFVKKPGRRFLPNPIPGLKLVFKPGAVDTIKRSKGWDTDAEMAQALGITRAYVSMMAKRRVSVSHNIILGLAYLMGNINGKWWAFYEIIDRGEPVDPDSPLWNEDKYQGRMPYSRYSKSAELRSLDYKVERRSIEQEFRGSGRRQK